MKKKVLCAFIIVLISVSAFFIFRKDEKKEAMKLYDSIKNIGYYLSNNEDVFTREFNETVTGDLMDNDFKKSICYLSFDSDNISVKDFNKRYKKLFNEVSDGKNFNMIFNNKSTKVNMSGKTIKVSEDIVKSSKKVKLHNYSSYDNNTNIVINSDNRFYGFTFNKKKNIVSIEFIY